VILRYTLAVVLFAVTGSAVIAASAGSLGEAGVRGALLGAALASLGAIFGMAVLARSFERGARTQFYGAVMLGIPRAADAFLRGARVRGAEAAGGLQPAGDRPCRSWASSSCSRLWRSGSC